MSKLQIKPSKLNGSILIPPSKSISHRAIICAALCGENKKSIIKNISLSDDINATILAMKRLGANISMEKDKNNRYTLEIERYTSFVDKAELDCNESGSTLRFLIPIANLFCNESIFTGNGKLAARPLDVYYQIFNEQSVKYHNTNGRLPLHIYDKIKGGELNIRGDISSQFISGLLFVLPLLEGNSVIKLTTMLESKGYVDLTIDTLNKFGVKLNTIDNSQILIQGNQKYTSINYEIEGDYSQAAFYLVANELNNNIIIEGLNKGSRQGDKKILEIIDILKANDDNNICIDVCQIPDLVPILAVLAALQDKKTISLVNAKRLRIKESDRLHAIASQLQLMGADIIEQEASLTIQGKASLQGGATVNSFNDHRIAMALAIAAASCEQQIILEDYKAVNKSYPDFWRDYVKLGGCISELDFGK